MALNVVEGVEDDHAGSDGDAVVDSLPAIRIAAENAQSCFAHEGAPGCERCMASFQLRGKEEPATFHCVNFVGPMWVVNAAVRAAAFLAPQGAMGNRFGNGEHGLQVVGEVPAGIEET